MKLLAAKYIYPLVVLSMLISIGLQAAWLNQLFKDEKQRTTEEVENLVAVSAKNNLFATLDKILTGNQTLNRFFLSPEWGEIWLGFDRAKDVSLYKSFDINPQADSTILDLHFVFLQHRPAHRSSPKFGMGYSRQQMDMLDSISLISFKRSVGKGLDSLGLRSGHYFLTFSYADHQVTDDPKAAGYVSKRYGYNSLHLHTAQLIVHSLNSLVCFKMRYYLISSVLMVTLTGTAFYYMLRLMISSHLYADARVAFTSNMTHEIKTPIATIALAMESISKYNLVDDPEKLERYLNMGKQELQRLSHLVEKVLALSQDDNQIKLNLVFFDVQISLSDVIRSMELPLKNARASCEMAVSPEPCFIEGDTVHLTTVFFNLIENAVKYAVNPLKLKIIVSSDRGWITIDFRDNGPGIPDVYKDKIFERFFRVPQSGNTHPIKGSGLGLNYVLGVIKSHKGSITLKSEPGSGSTFTIKLPAAKYEG